MGPLCRIGSGNRPNGLPHQQTILRRRSLCSAAFFFMLLDCISLRLACVFAQCPFISLGGKSQCEHPLRAQSRLAELCMT